MFLIFVLSVIGMIVMKLALGKSSGVFSIENLTSLWPFFHHLEPLGPVSRKSRNFSGIFRVP